MGTHGATGSEVAMRSPFSRTFKWFLLWIGIETIGRYIDPNELINQRPILAIEKTYVPGDRPWTNEDLAYYLYDNAPADYNVKVLGYSDISGYSDASGGRVRRGSESKKKKLNKQRPQVRQLPQLLRLPLLRPLRQVRPELPQELLLLLPLQLPLRQVLPQLPLQLLPLPP